MVSSQCVSSDEMWGPPSIHFFFVQLQHWYGFSRLCRYIFKATLSKQCLIIMYWYGFPPMLSQVQSKIDTTRESLNTLATLIRFLSIVYSQMFCKNTHMCESFITLVTMIWFLPSMCSHMYFKITTLCVCLITMVTLIWFHSSVCFQMSFKLTVVWKSLNTLGVLVWFLDSVCSQMYYKFFIKCIRFIALATLIWWLISRLAVTFFIAWLSDMWESNVKELDPIPIPSRPSEARQSGHDTWAVTIPERWLTGLTALARLSWWIQSLPGWAKRGKAVTTHERCACQTSSLARLSWWIQSLPGRAK